MRLSGQSESAMAVYDNSPVPQASECQQQQLFAYKHDPGNSGLSVAYNWALSKSTSIKANWLLLLDQDSVLPPNFFESALHQIRFYESDRRVAAIVPIVRSDKNVVSPMRVTWSGLKQLSPPKPGIQNVEVTAINSGVLIRCPFITLIGGFDQAYRLDLLDHWLFAQIYKRGFYVALTDLEILHNLSSCRPHEYSTRRYQSILSGERQFVLSSKSPSDVLLYRVRLFCRAIKQLIRYRRPDLCIMTIRQLCH
jgi:GT2 family glycosyltransferase